MTKVTVKGGLTQDVEHSSTEPRVGSSNLSGRASPSNNQPEVAAATAEDWRPIPDTSGLYEASSLGRIRRAPGSWYRGGAPRVLRQRLTAKGYPIVDVTIGGRSISKTVHRLIAAAFLGADGGRQVDHRNGIKTDNRAENLEYVTGAENMRRSWAEGGAHRNRAVT
jgi:hypothetical protein